MVKPGCGGIRGAHARQDTVDKRIEQESAIRPAPWPTTAGNRLRVTSQPQCGRRIDVQIEVMVQRSVAEMWRRVSDLRRFLVIDPFHERVIVMRRRATAGVHLVLRHNALGHRFTRYGRILCWREGHGYTFSDLSGRDPRRGFPHVFVVELEALLEAGEKNERPTTRVTITVRGKWTARWIPIVCGRWWVHRVCREHGRLLRKAL